MYRQEVTAAIKAECKIMREKLNNYSDTKLKQRKLEFIKENERFPSMLGLRTKDKRKPKPGQITARVFAEIARNHNSTMKPSENSRKVSATATLKDVQAGFVCVTWMIMEKFLMSVTVKPVPATSVRSVRSIELINSLKVFL